MFDDYIDRHVEVISKLKGDEKIQEVTRVFLEAVTNKRTVFCLGNGGSAADAQHFAAELVGRFEKERRAVRALALTVDTSILTAVGNDYGFDKVFSRQVEALGSDGDLLLGISTSGNSSNVIKACEVAKKKGMNVIILTGNDGGKLHQVHDLCIKVDSDKTRYIQEAHILILHYLCLKLDEVLT